MKTSRRSPGILALGLCLLGLLATEAASLTAANTSPSAPACGRGIYNRHCASCHGDSGLGDGPGAAVLDPKPRNFGLGKFRLVSTDNGVPTEQDLFDVVTRGIVGSAMPPHEHLSEDARWAVVGYVQDLARERQAEIHRALAQGTGTPMTLEEARVAVFTEPGPVVELPVAIPRTAELLERGRELYVQSCAACHDADGTGRTRDDMVDSQGRPTFARDFTVGVMKGGSEPVDLHRRVRCGMPGSPMPAYEFTAEDSWAMTYYVESLMQPEAREPLGQTRTSFQPQSVTGTLSADPEAAVWQQVEAHWVPMAPLQWTDERVDGLMLQVAQDDRFLGFRLVWEDSTPQSGSGNVTPDTALIRFSAGRLPQFFCPGRTGETGEYWEWQADLGNFRHAGLGVEVRARHERGNYEAVFLRELDKSPARVGMSPDGASLAFEIRNGAAGDPDRSQNITIWHHLAASARQE